MSDETRVLYNADCPVCNFEIQHYVRYSNDKALRIRFEDLNCDDLSSWGVSQDDAARRLYVLKDGALLSGIPAFLVLWDDMPRYRWLARLVRLPGIHAIAVVLYDRVAAPLIYRGHVKRLKKRGKLKETKC